MKGKITIVVRVLSILVILVCLVNIINWYKDNKKSANILEDINSTITVKKEEVKIAEKEIKTYNIDFQALKDKNPDTVAYLKVNGTKIAYPVVKSNDNSFYLSHSFDKSYNSAGWIFADYRNKFDGTDRNIVIYGHNRRDGSMFASLKNVLNSEWYNNEDNKFIILETEAGTQVYEVFSVYKVSVEEYYTRVNFETDEQFGEFIYTLKLRSDKNFNVFTTNKDSILTLSTCDNNNKYRVVLHAKEVVE